MREQRREFIITRLRDVNEIDYDEIHERFGEHYDAGKVPQASIHSDISYLQSDGWAISTLKLGRKTKIIFGGGRAFTVYEEKQISNRDEKKAIAWLVAGIISGLDETQKRQKNRPKGLVNFASKREIVAWLKARNSNLYNKILLEKLEKFWSKRQRDFALDSGTTNYSIALKIKELQLPDTALDHLRCLTNNRLIYEILGHLSCRIRTTILGGQQRHQSSSISGEAALKCLNAWDPKFLMSIIGATAFDPVSGVMGAYDEADGRLKSELLSRGDFKLIVMDHTKISRITRQSGRRVFGFAKCDTDSVDLIITDKFCDPWDRQFLSHFKVPILAASDFDYENNYDEDF